MGRCLIVANQTLGGELLDESVRDCISRGVTVFYVVVPQTKVKDESASWRGGFGLDEDMSYEEMVLVRDKAARDHEAALEESRRRAQRRLELMIDKIQAAGGQSEGEVGDDDPCEATRAALNRQDAFDEIIVSTLPVGLSRWLKMDVPHRIARLTDVPVTTVEAAAETA
jgi:hypothetical protein